jgi:hypothetical protein
VTASPDDSPVTKHTAGPAWAVTWVPARPFPAARACCSSPCPPAWPRRRARNGHRRSTPLRWTGSAARIACSSSGSVASASAASRGRQVPELPNGGDAERDASADRRQQRHVSQPPPARPAVPSGGGQDVPGPGAEGVQQHRAREALTNVARHAPAARAWLEVAHGPSELTVTVTDGGSGPPQPAAVRRTRDRRNAGTSRDARRPANRPGQARGRLCRGGPAAS